MRSIMLSSEARVEAVAVDEELPPPPPPPRRAVLAVSFSVGRMCSFSCSIRRWAVLKLRRASSWGRRRKGWSFGRKVVSLGALFLDEGMEGKAMGAWERKGEGIYEVQLAFWHQLHAAEVCHWNWEGEVWPVLPSCPVLWGLDCRFRGELREMIDSPMFNNAHTVAHTVVRNIPDSPAYTCTVSVVVELFWSSGVVTCGTEDTRTVTGVKRWRGSSLCRLQLQPVSKVS